MKILITSVGSLVAQNILDSLEGRRAGMRIIGVNSVAATPNNFRCDVAYLAPAASETHACRQRLEAIIRAEQPDVVLPGRDDDVLLLAALRDEIPAFRPIIPCGPAALARIIGDKFLSYRFALDHGLPFAATAMGDADALHSLVAEYGFPLIGKPRSGNGSRGVVVVFNADQLAAASRLDAYLFQEYLDPGDEVMRMAQGWCDGVPLFLAPRYSQYACQCLISPAGKIEAMLCTEVVMVIGRAERSAVIGDPDISVTVAAYAEAFAAIGWVGPLNLQGRRDRAGKFKVYELNGRFTGATTARLHHGFDEVGRLLQQFTGRALPPSAHLGGADRIVFKSLVEFALAPRDVAELARAGVWQSAAD